VEQAIVEVGFGLYKLDDSVSADVRYGPPLKFVAIKAWELPLASSTGESQFW
jgi:hypothetical protein